MSFESMEGQRRDTADSILAKIDATNEKAEQNAAAKTTDRAMRKLMRARMTLEYAVLATAREKNVDTEMVGTAFKGATVAQHAAMLKEVFQPRPPQFLQFSNEFTSFSEPRDKGIPIEAIKEVRGVTQSQTVQKIAAKL